MFSLLDEVGLRLRAVGAKAVTIREFGDQGRSKGSESFDRFVEFMHAQVSELRAKAEASAKLAPGPARANRKRDA